jgi:hypothetical protein
MREPAFRAFAIAGVLVPVVGWAQGAQTKPTTATLHPALKQ